MRYVMYLTCMLLIGLLASNSEAADCEFTSWKSFKNTKLFIHHNTQTYFFSTTHMAVDADGAPNAYHPDNIGLDYLGNAGYPNKSWWKDILVVDPNDSNRAYIQKTGEFAGYFVSKTSLKDEKREVTDPSRYVDSRHIPYFVFPIAFYKMKRTGLIGDLGLAINLSTKDKTAFVVADIGPSRASLGEVSISLAERLGGKNVNPKNGSGVPDGEILYIVFPYSSREYKWPMSYEEMSATAEKLLKGIGGLDSILSCVNNL